MTVAIAGCGLWSTLGTNRAAHRDRLTEASLPQPGQFTDSTGRAHRYFHAAPPARPAQPASTIDRLSTVIDEAVAEAGLDSTTARSVPWLLASSSMNIADYEAQLDPASTQPPFIGPRFSLLLDELRSATGHSGRACVFSSACASAANALLHGFHLIRSGQAEHVVVIGSESVNRMSLDGFGALMLLTPSGRYAPFDAERDGLILGEAAAAIVLSRARAEPAPGTVLMRGGAARCAPGNPTMCTADDLLTVMQAALTQAHTTADELLAIRAHGTGTPANDRAEGLAIRQLVGERVPFSSYKPWFGHTLGASGLVELIALINGWEQQRFLHTPGYTTPDPEIGVAPLAQTTALPAAGTILCNSFGFGGNNTALVVERTC